MTNKQAFIIGISFIIGLIVHGFIVQEKYQIALHGKDLFKINTRTGEASIFDVGVRHLSNSDWHLLPLKEEDQK